MNANIKSQKTKTVLSVYPWRLAPLILCGMISFSQTWIDFLVKQRPKLRQPEGHDTCFFFLCALLCSDVSLVFSNLFPKPSLFTILPPKVLQLFFLPASVFTPLCYLREKKNKIFYIYTLNSSTMLGLCLLRVLMCTALTDRETEAQNLKPLLK